MISPILKENVKLRNLFAQIPYSDKNTLSHLDLY